jgi:hypothetical protein
MPFLLPVFRIPGSEGSIGLNDRIHTLLVPIVHRQPAVSVALTTEVSGTGCAPQGVIGTEMSGAGTPDSAAPSGAASARGSSGPMRLKLPGPYLPGSSDFASPPVNWRQVESEAELACS